MADAMQGIMALSGAPTMDQGPRPMMGQEAQIDPSLVDPSITQYARSDPKGFSDDIVGGMEQADPQLVYQLRSMLAQYQLPQEVIDALALMVDTLLSDPGNYQENRMEFIREGVPEEILPPTFDAAYLAGLGVALNQMSGMVEPQRFARGGIAELKPIAQALSQMGRNGDSMLAHINPAEARLLRVMGGSGTINPYTGMPEFFLGKVVKAVGGAVKGVAKAVGGVVKGAAKVVTGVVKGVANVVKAIAKSPIGKIALTAAAVYFMGPTALNVAGNLGLKGATALGVNTFLGNTAVNLASGQSLKQSIKNGALAGLTAGAVSSVFPSTLPSGYEAGPPAGIPAVGGTDVIPPPAPGDYATSADALALDTAAAREAADFARAGAAAPVDQGIGSLAQSNLTTTAPGVTAPSVAPVATEIPQAGGSFMDTAKSAYETVASPIRSAYETVATPVKDFYSEYMSPSRGMPTQADISARAGELVKEAQAAGSSISYKDAMDLASKQLMANAPGAIARYAPLALAGTGALMAAGAFTPVQPEPPGLVGDMATTPPVPKDIGMGDVNIVNAPPPGSGTGYDLGDTSFYTTGSQYDPSRQFNVPQFTVRKPEDYLYAMNMFPQQQTQTFADGGIASLGYKAGGKVRTYPRKTGAINGPGTETSDSIPALLSDGEFVFTAKAVRGAGGGSRRAGAKRMYALMKALENKANGR